MNVVFCSDCVDLCITCDGPAGQHKCKMCTEVVHSPAYEKDGKHCSFGLEEDEGAQLCATCHGEVQEGEGVEAIGKEKGTPSHEKYDMRMYIYNVHKHCIV